MTNEELLAEAKRRYPVGTKFKCKNLSSLCEVTTDGRWDTVNIDNKPSVIFYPKEVFGKYAYLGWLSTDWAEIVETPKQEEYKVGDWVKLEEWASNEYFKVSRIEGNSLYLQYDGEEWEYNLNQGKWLVRNNTPQTTTTYEKQVDNNPPKVIIGNTAIDITAPKTSNSVTLGQIQKEINVKINFKQSVKI